MSIAAAGWLAACAATGAAATSAVAGSSSATASTCAASGLSKGERTTQRYERRRNHCFLHHAVPSLKTFCLEGLSARRFDRSAALNLFEPTTL
jgi:hypothetical protein